MADLCGEFRRVERAERRVGSSLFASFKYRFWVLHLECGHEVERRMRYRKRPNAPRGFGALHHPPTEDDCLPAPKRVLCKEENW